MKRPIVIEGPDGAGKSTLRDRLAADLGRTPIHTGGPTRTVTDVRRRNEAMLGFERGKVIFDRVSAISDNIYRQAEGRPILVPFEEQLAFLHKFGVVIVYCRLKSSAEMIEYIDQTPKPHKPADYLEKVISVHPRIVELYDETMKLVQRSGISVYHHDWKRDDYFQLLENLKCVA
jgi:hypothetical protein